MDKNLLHLFTIFDTKAQGYLQPFFSINPETAQREFAAAVNGEGQFAEFAEDYSLFLVGRFDQATGELVSLPAPEHVCNAVTLRTAQKGLGSFMNGIPMSSSVEEKEHTQ